jgi:hypothetical protein
METSIFIAKIFSVVYFFLGIGLLFNQKYYKKGLENMISNFSIMFLFGIIAIIS